MDNLGGARVQFCEFEVTSCRKCRIRFKNAFFLTLPRLSCENDEALSKDGFLAGRFDTDTF